MTRLANLCALHVLLTTMVASSALAQAPGPRDFVLFGDQGIRARGLVVSKGDVGTNGSLVATKRIDAPGSRIAAGGSVNLHPASVCKMLFANGGQSAAACGPATAIAGPVVANPAEACGITSALPTQCTGGVTVPMIRHDETRTLSPLQGRQQYGSVEIAGGGAGPGTLVLEAGTYTFCSLKLSRNARLLARGPVTINVIGAIKLDNGSTVGPETSAVSPCQVQLFASTTGKVRISRKATLTGILCAPNASLELTVGATIQGAAYARTIKSDRVFLTKQVCAPPTTTSSTTSSTSTTSVATTSTSSTSVAPGTTTTTSTVAPSTSSSTSTTTSSSSSTSQPGLCGNGKVDEGEPCDPSSPGGAFTCPEGSTCSPQCTCIEPTTTSSSTAPVPTTTLQTTTTSTLQTTTSSSPPTTTSSSTSQPVPTTTPTTTTVPTTSSTSTSSSTTVVATTSSTTTTTAGGDPHFFDFLSTSATGSCGNTFRDVAGTTPLKNVLCGNLSLGGGASQVPDNVTPPGAVNRFTLSCAGSACTVGPVATATASYDCTGTGCKFGTPLPISNAGLSVCVTNTYSQPASGTLDRSTGAATLDFELNSATVLTGNPSQPCPICAVAVGGAACVGSVASPCTGVCDGSPNQGAACTSKNQYGLTSDCPSPSVSVGVQKCYRGANNGNTCTTSADCTGGQCAQFIGDIPISLNPLTTGTSSLSSATGLFCPNQAAAQVGAFKSDICKGGTNTGKPCTVATGAADCGVGTGISCRTGTLNNYCNGGTNDGVGCSTNTDCGTGGTCVKAGTLARLVRVVGAPAGALALNTPKAIKLGSAFCVLATTNPTVNANANLPGPGATALVGTVTLLP